MRRRSNRARPDPGATRRRRRTGAWLAAVLLGAALGVLGLLAVQRATSPGPEGPVAVPPAVVDQIPDLTVTLSAGLLAALIQQSIDRGESPVPLEKVRVETRDGRLIVHGDAGVFGRSVSGEIEMAPYPDAGGLRLRVLRARLGRLPVPADLERLAEGPINARLAAVLGDLPATVTGARADSRGLTVTARVDVDQLLPAGR